MPGRIVDINISKMPDGFTLTKMANLDALIIHYKRTAMISMNLFIIFWFILWTAISIFLLYVYLYSDKMVSADPVPFWIVSLFWSFEIAAAALFFYLFFGKLSFHIHDDDLKVSKELFGFGRIRLFPRTSITRIVQVKNGGEGRDSFTSWGLVMDAGKRWTLIYRQPYESSHWLGQIISGWAGVEFNEAYKD